MSEQSHHVSYHQVRTQLLIESIHQLTIDQLLELWENLTNNWHYIIGSVTLRRVILRELIYRGQERTVFLRPTQYLFDTRVDL